MLTEFYEIQNIIASGMPVKTERYLMSQIEFDERLIGIIGPRGTGKTTLIFQHYVRHYGDPSKFLYISGDNIRVLSSGLFNIAKEHVQYGGKVLCVDEVHRYPNWAQEIKNIYDSFPKLKIIISGSSSLHIRKLSVDLSRRLVFYHLHELSFREYLNFQYSINFPVYSVADITHDHVKIAAQISGKIRVLKYFKEYLEYGNFPFILEGKQNYKLKIIRIIDKVLYEDLPAVHPVKYSGIMNLKRLLNIIATSKPFQVNIEEMSRNLGISKEYLYRYLEYLCNAYLIQLIWYRQRGNAYRRKPAKLYFHNPNFLSAFHLSESLENYIGTIRECFFAHQLIQSNSIYVSKIADFEIEDQIHFEIGGKSKVCRSEKNLFYAIDGIEIGSGNKIPLYLFGFLY